MSVDLYDKDTKILYRCQAQGVKPRRPLGSSEIMIKQEPVAKPEKPVAAKPRGPKRPRTSALQDLRSKNASYLEPQTRDDQAAHADVDSGCQVPKQESNLLDRGDPYGSRGPYRIVDATPEHVKFFINAKELKGRLANGDVCKIRHILFDPRQWDVLSDGQPVIQEHLREPVFDPSNLLEVSKYLGPKYTFLPEEYRFTSDVRDRAGRLFKNVLVMPPSFNTMCKIIPPNTVFKCRVNQRDYSINVLKKFGGLDTKTDNLHLRFGTQTVDESPFHAFARASDCLEIVFDKYTRSCNIEYLQLRPIFLLENFYDENGDILVEKQALYNTNDNWIHCAQPLDSSRTGCITDLKLLRLNKKKNPQELDTLRSDFKAQVWIEIARQFSLYIGLTTHITLNDYAVTTWSTVGPTTDPKNPNFSYLIFSHYMIGRKGQTLYETFVPSLRPTTIPFDIYRWFTKYYLLHKKFKDVAPVFQNDFVALYNATQNTSKTPNDFANMNIQDISSKGTTRGIVSIYGDMVSKHGLEISTFLQKTSINSKIAEIFTKKAPYNTGYFLYTCSYFLWFGLIKSGLDESTIPQNIPSESGYYTQREVYNAIEAFDPYMDQFYFNTLNSSVARLEWLDWAPCFAS